MVGRLLKVDVKAMEKCWKQIQTFLDELDERNVEIAISHNLH